MNKLSLTLTFILTTVISLFGQRTVTGRLLDKDSGKPVKDAIITLINTDFETKTNALGFFQLEIDTIDIVIIKSDEYPLMQTRIPSEVNSFTIHMAKNETVAPKDSTLFLVVEQPASFPGGFQKFYDYVSKNLKYPKSARQAGLTGKVFVEFVINRDGTIDPESVRAVPAEEMAKFNSFAMSETIKSSDCEAEAIRIIKNSPNWNPGQQKGKPVRQKMVVPIMFK